jgi:carbonic anhydrase
MSTPTRSESSDAFHAIGRTALHARLHASLPVAKQTWSDRSVSPRVDSKEGGGKGEKPQNTVKGASSSLPAAQLSEKDLEGGGSILRLNEALRETDGPSHAALLSLLTTGNAEFAVTDAGRDFEENADQILQTQAPAVTMLACADSRIPRSILGADFVHTNVLFGIRNIGNQFHIGEGSVKYSLLHLKTPLCLVLGHTGCGAVKAAAGDYRNLDMAIQRELLGISSCINRLRAERGVAPSEGDMEELTPQLHNEYVEQNVDQQVRDICNDRSCRSNIQNEKLVVVGAVFDMSNEYGKGHARFHIVNINGVSDVERLRKSALVQEIPRGLLNGTVCRVSEPSEDAGIELRMADDDK